MNINQIKYFVSVVEKGSFSLAAQERFVTVQAVSKSIGDLERELKVALFSRDNRGVTPTTAGQEFYRLARPVAKGFEELENFVPSSNSEKPSEHLLRIGLCAPAFKGNEQTRSVIGKFLSVHLNIPVSIPLVKGSIALSALQDHEVDGLITVGPYDNPLVECRRLQELPTSVVMSSTHPLAKKKTVTLEDLKGYPVGASREFDTFNESILHAYLKAGMTNETRLISTPDEFLAFVEKDQGLFFAAIVSDDETMYPRTVARPLTGEGALTIPVCLLTLKDHQPEDYARIQSFLELAGKHFIDA